MMILWPRCVVAGLWREVLVRSGSFFLRRERTEVKVIRLRALSSLVALAFVLSTAAANCQEQLDATLTADAGSAVSPQEEQVDAALSDTNFSDAGEADGTTGDATTADSAVVVEAGLEDGAVAADASTGFDGPDQVDGALGDAWGRVHPLDWHERWNHGPAAVEQRFDCRLCHGQTLDGFGNAVSCSSCHDSYTPDWRTDCLFCHGGSDNSSGAPPLDLHGETDPARMTVGAHTEHGEGAGHLDYSCDECHLTPTDVLSPGHMFDDSAGQAEVSFGAGISPSGGYAGGACSAVYCHGDGLVPGASPSFDDGADLGCVACHPATSSSDWSSMSGRHSTHLGRGEVCAECHAAVVDNGDQVIAAVLHVDGVAQVQVPTGAFDVATDDCTTSCHSTTDPRNWITGGYHPAGWDQELNHGPAALNANEDCTSCHGVDLTGGTSGIDCDSCHITVDPDWRTNCVFCHGDGDNPTGAPPIDLDGSSDSGLLSVGAHTEHVTQTDHPAFDCSECHLKPTDVTSPGHMFDGSAGVAEVVFDSVGGTLSAAAGYSAPGCSALYCHGDDGRDNGSVGDFTGSISACDACHPFLNSSTDDWNSRMSGKHKKHLESTDDGRIGCWECHGNVVDGSDSINAAQLHVNGVAEIQLEDGTYTVAGRSCSTNSECHGKDHNNRNWGN